MLTAEHTRIIDQLNEGHAAMTAAGLGSPALDDFHKLQVQIITESDDPQAAIRALADLMAEHARTTGAAS
jgi:hypothetical protein